MGMKRTCVKFGKVGTKRGRELRCAKFKRKSQVGKHPKCDARLVAGGRSPGLLRKRHCSRRRG